MGATASHRAREAGSRRGGAAAPRRRRAVVGSAVEPRHWLHLRRAALAMLVLAAGVAFWGSGIGSGLSPERLRHWVEASGPWGPPLFVVAFALGELLHVPSVLFVVGAGLVWPLPLAWATAFVGSVAAATCVFSFARALGADWVQERIPPSLRRYDDRLVRDGWRTVALVRLFTFMMPVVHWVLGVSRVRFRDALLGTAVGLLPGVTLFVVLGERLTGGWERARPWVLGTVAVVLAARWVWRRRAARAAGGHPPADRHCDSVARPGARPSDSDDPTGHSALRAVAADAPDTRNAHRGTRP